MDEIVYTQEIIPSAKRLMKSLRDLGYDFSQAVADLIDNSIEAGATEISIDVEFSGDNSRVRIADNGKGMTFERLYEAMRYGSEREFNKEEDLGKFGLGLKTASLSQCQRFSVASRVDFSTNDINACCWDLSHVEKVNRWELIKPKGKDLEQILKDRLRDSTGTIVLWQKLDRMLGMKHPYSEAARKRLFGMCRELEQHLAMVFHRFLSGEIPNKKIKIILNDNEIEPWDPFVRNEPKTKKLEDFTIFVQSDNVSGQINFSPYILPPKDKSSSSTAFIKASGPLNWNQQQGLYIHRANRLIQSGGWSKLRTSDEHTKLARIALGFPNKLDDLFKVNVSKMKVQIPSQLKEEIENNLKPVIKLAQETYRKSGLQKYPTSTTPPVTSQGNPKPPPHSNPPVRLWTLDDLQKGLSDISRFEERLVINQVFDRFREKIGA